MPLTRGVTRTGRRERGAENRAGGRPSNEDLRRDLREVTRRIRPDWDLGAPGLRDRWEQGARDDFWPYGRSLREVLATPGS
jgi:hypothetical protein